MAEAEFTPGPWSLRERFERADEEGMWLIEAGPADNPYPVAEATRKADALAIKAIPRLLLALLRWRCGSCGGTGEYRDKSLRTGAWVEQVVTCRVCGGNGRNPIAHQAIEEATGGAHD